MSGGRRPGCWGDLGALPRTELQSLPHCTHHSRVASVVQPQGRYRALYAYQRHTGP